jgi:hypothetical protein
VHDAREQCQASQLIKGYNGWNEDLVTKVVAALDEATGRGWSPSAPLPDVAPLLNARRRPPVEAVISRNRITTAVIGLWADTAKCTVCQGSGE